MRAQQIHVLIARSPFRRLGRPDFARRWHGGVTDFLLVITTLETTTNFDDALHETDVFLLPSELHLCSLLYDLVQQSRWTAPEKCPTVAAIGQTGSSYSPALNLQGLDRLNTSTRWYRQYSFEKSFCLKALCQFPQSQGSFGMDQRIELDLRQTVLPKKFLASMNWKLFLVEDL